MLATKLAKGVRVGNYVLERTIAAGATGVVFKAHDERTDRSVALKLLGTALARPGELARFHHEARIVAQLDHPGIVPILDVGQDEHIAYMAMELVAGVSLRTVLDAVIHPAAEDSTDANAMRRENAVNVVASRQINRFDTVPLVHAAADTVVECGVPHVLAHRSDPAYFSRCCEIIRDAARALSFAHRRGVVHRDVKPENLMLDVNGHARVIDFGVAAFIDSTAAYASVLPATPMYMSPEQVVGERQVDHRSDLYSLGLVLYEMLTLRRPLRATTAHAMLHEIVTRQLPTIQKCNRAIPDALAAVVHKATNKDPNERYQTGDEFAADLERFLAGEPVTAPTWGAKQGNRAIVAERPHEVVTAAWFLFFAAVGYALLKLPPMLQAAAGLVTPTTLLQPFGMSGAVVGAVIAAWGLLTGRQWGRSAAIGALGMLLVFVSLDLKNWIAFVYFVSWQPDHMTPVLAILPMLAFPVTAGLCAAFFIVQLFRPRVVRWTNQAAELRHEF